MIAHYYQVNAIAVYVMGGTWGFLILATAIASIVQCLSHKYSSTGKFKETQKKAEAPKAQ